MGVTTFNALMKQNMASLAHRYFKDVYNRITNILNKIYYKHIVDMSKVKGMCQNNNYISIK